MDEQRAIEKTASELKTIQNRLKKLLKVKQSAEPQQVADLKSIISNFRSQIDEASGELYSKENQVLDLESQMGDKDKIIAILKNQRNALVKELKQNKKSKALHVYELAGEDIKRNGYHDILLPEGYIKFWKNGKCGIRDKNGKIVVDNKYDELGSFRSNIVGFVYGTAEIVEKVPPYLYRIPLAAKYKYSNKEGYAFEVGGVDCYIPASAQEKWFIPGEYYFMIIDKVINKFQEIELTEVTLENTSEVISYIDKDEDFKTGKVVEGYVCNIKYGYRFEINCNNGKKTYVTKQWLNSNGIKSDRVFLGTTFTLKKIGYDPFYKSTEWSLVSIEHLG
jgi:hypothetical protein